MTTQQQFDLQRVAQSVCNTEGFTFVREIGGGTFKRVFLVGDAGGISYALKIVAESTPRIPREEKAMQRCDHPNIARLIRVGKHVFEDRCYDFFLEEYLSGGSLADRLRGQGQLDNRSMLTLGTSLIGALGQLDGLSIVHRDIKPENIMFRPDGITPVLTDFGLVRDLAASSITPTWALSGPGTPYWSAPEQLNNDKPLQDWRTDQFSLGIVLYFARFGRHPYQHPGEQLFHPDTVTRIANRGLRSDDFFADVRAANLPCLVVMTEPWPIQRFRRPDDLASAWLAQPGGPI
jgi:serine/threonine protein kinase